MATPIRFELTIFAVTGRHVNRYTTGPFHKVLRYYNVDYRACQQIFYKTFVNVYKKSADPIFPDNSSKRMACTRRGR